MLYYGQYGEDVFFERCFGSQSTGTYIDIGASHPVLSNSTYHLYLKGWTGLLVEPLPHRIAECRAIRPRDTCVQAAVGKSLGQISFNVPEGADHLSSFKDLSPELVPSKRMAVYSVPLTTIPELWTKYNLETVDVLKIDVEGAEDDVVIGNDWSRYRPKVLMLESIEALTFAPNHFDWDKKLTDAHYDFVHFDGANRYYVADEHAGLKAKFADPIGPSDHASALHWYGNPLEDRRHPDHRWALSFCTRLLASPSALTDDLLISVFSADYSPGRMQAVPSENDVHDAFQRVFGRSAGAADIAHWTRPGHTNEMLLRELITGEEFHLRRGRTSILSMYRP